jgi:hypothetical protein
MVILRWMKWRQHVRECIVMKCNDFFCDLTKVPFREIHREQLALERSMSDMDSAVGRLDNLFMSLYVVVAALIIAVALEAQLMTLITGAGALLLGM